jgi:hypothetical protein
MACIQREANARGDGKLVDDILNHVPGGSYSSWSEDDKQHAGVALQNICGRKCRSYADQARAGSMRASYEAAACTLACYVNNLPADYPRLDEYRRDAKANYKAAKDLGSNAPVFLNQ